MPLINPTVGREIPQLQGHLPPAGYVFQTLDDFLYGTDATATTFASVWTTSASGAGAARTAWSAAIAEANHPGINYIETGTTAAGAFLLHLGAATSNIYILPNGYAFFEAMIRIPILRTAPQAFSVRIGLMNLTVANAVPTSGVYFSYNASGFWGCAALNNPGVSAFESTALVSTDWVRLGLTVVGTVATYYINGVRVGELTTNIPDAADTLTPEFQIQKSVGTTSRAMRVDYMSYQYSFSPTR